MNACIFNFSMQTKMVTYGNPVNFHLLSKFPASLSFPTFGRKYGTDQRTPVAHNL